MIKREPAKILLVDDEKDLSDSIVNWLTEENYVIDCAYDGLEALAKLNAIEYDLLILDITLPIFDGMDICSIVRGYRPRIPILIITAYPSSIVKKKSFEIGADAFMTKPFKLSKLSKCIHNLLSTDRGGCNSLEHSLI